MPGILRDSHDPRRGVGRGSWGPPTGPHRLFHRLCGERAPRCFNELVNEGGAVARASNPLINPLKQTALPLASKPTNQLTGWLTPNQPITQPALT